jgi:DNA-binding HxlR family transcriptional regulator
MTPGLTTPANASHAAALEALGNLDDTIHQKARLGIMSTLLALGEADFKLLKETLALSDGNLSTHLALLEERGYVGVRKEFVRRKPHTTYTPTEAGRMAFQNYLLALERIISAAGSAGQNSRDVAKSDVSG